MTHRHRHRRGRRDGMGDATLLLVAAVAAAAGGGRLVAVVRRRSPYAAADVGPTDGQVVVHGDQC